MARGPTLRLVDVSWGPTDVTWRGCRAGRRVFPLFTEFGTPLPWGDLQPSRRSTTGPLPWGLDRCVGVGGGGGQDGSTGVARLAGPQHLRTPPSTPATPSPERSGRARLGLPSSCRARTVLSPVADGSVSAPSVVGAQGARDQPPRRRPSPLVAVLGTGFGAGSPCGTGKQQEPHSEVAHSRQPLSHSSWVGPLMAVSQAPATL